MTEPTVVFCDVPPIPTTQQLNQELRAQQEEGLLSDPQVKKEMSRIPSVADEAAMMVNPILENLARIHFILVGPNDGHPLINELARVFVDCHKLANQVLEYATKLDQLSKEMIKQVLKAHFDAQRNYSASIPNLRYPRG